MKNKHRFWSTAAHISLSLAIGLTVYTLNIVLLSSSKILTPGDALFIEGTMAILVGILLLLGRGGISFLSKQAAVLAATAEAVCGTDSVGPGEMMRRDTWQPKGFLRVGLVMIVTGVFLITLYFLTL
jgi:hypothetical protein